MTPQQATMLDALTCDPVDLLERAACAGVLDERARWPQRLAEMFDVEFAYNLRAGMDRDAAARNAAERTILLADYLGGSSIYLPRGEALRQAVHDSEVYARHRGTANHAALAREINITETKLYELIARELKRRKEKRQGRLFAETKP